jgi:hypothetical protein
MKKVAGTSAVALAVAAFLASLSLVSWRQREALETMTLRDSLKQEMVVEEANRQELERRIIQLRSLSRIVGEAEGRLGMRRAEDTEIFDFTGEES